MTYQVGAYKAIQVSTTNNHTITIITITNLLQPNVWYMTEELP